MNRSVVESALEIQTLSHCLKKYVIKLKDVIEASARFSENELKQLNILLESTDLNIDVLSKKIQNIKF